MPNHVLNQITVQFDKEEDYDKFKELVVGDESQQEFDFDKIVPQPDDINPDLPQNVKEIDGFCVSETDWYDWRCKNWGTKWNAYDIEIEWDDKYKEHIEIEFKTAWSPPEPIYFKLRKIFGEDLYINWFCRDEGDNYCGYVHNQQYVNG